MPLSDRIPRCAGIYLPNMDDSEISSRQRSPYVDTYFPFATTASDDLVAWSPSRIPHRLITGHAGSGKTTIAHNLLRAALRAGWSGAVLTSTPDEYRDFTEHFRDISVATNPGEYFATIATASELLRARFVARKTEQAAREAQQVEVPLLIVVDEFVAVTSRVRDWAFSRDSLDAQAFYEDLCRIFRLGRAARIHVAAVTFPLAGRGTGFSEALDNAQLLSTEHHQKTL